MAQQGEALNHLRQPQILVRRDLRRDEPQRKADLSAGHEGVATQSGDLSPAEGEVDLAATLEELQLLGGEQTVKHRVDGRRGQRTPLGHRLQVTVDPDHRRSRRAQQQVGALALPEPLEELVSRHRRSRHPCRVAPGAAVSHQPNG